MEIGIISDLHLYNKSVGVEKALSLLRQVDLILIAGDIADRAQKAQYDILLKSVSEQLSNVPIYCVSGNHDNPARNDTNYREFEEKINTAYPAILDDSGAFYQYVGEDVDIVGLNPTYHQKQFFFSNKGQQLAFLQKQLSVSTAQYHIVLCHPPLIAHNPQRTMEMTPYIAMEQDRKLQEIINEKGNIVFVAGHTHFAPTVEWDGKCRNLYINNGSICPTTLNNCSVKTQQGNVTFLKLDVDGVSVVIKGIYSEKVFVERKCFM